MLSGARGSVEADTNLYDDFSNPLPLLRFEPASVETYTDGRVVSSRHINVLPVLQGTVACFHADSVIDVNTADDPFTTNCWVFLARNPGALNIPGLPPPGEMQIPPPFWTDDYSDIFRLIR